MINDWLSKLKLWLLNFWSVKKELFVARLNKYKQVFKDACKQILDKITISINTSILLVIASSLFVVGITAFLIDSFYYKKSFTSAASNLLENTDYLAKSKLTNYLQPFYSNLSLSVNLVQSGFLSTDNHAQFSKYMQNILQTNPSFINIYIGDSKGNLFLMTRGKEKNTYVMVYSMRLGEITKVTEDIFNQQGGKISTKEVVVQQPDPRTRPWYIQARQDKKITWSNVYSFHQYSGYVLPMLGMTACAPIYTTTGQLKGVFGIDLTLDQLTQSMEGTNLIAGTMVFLVGAKDEVDVKKLLYPTMNAQTVSFSFANSDKSGIKIDDLNSSIAEYSYKIFQQDNSNKFIYDKNNEKYLAYYKPLNDLFGSSWHVAVVMPEKSAHVYFRRYIVLIGGVFLLVMGSILGAVVFLSGRFTGAIHNILQYATKIEALDFSQKISTTSKIIEIRQIQKVMNLMGSVLKSFSRYVPTYLVRDVISSGDVSHIEGENKGISILFADIAGFSPLAEVMNPRDLMVYLSEYFNKMTNVVYSKGGTLDKYIGDAIMCFWGAPFEDKRHALHACQCAAMLFEHLKELNKQWKLRGLPQLKIRVSVNSGAAIVGNVGSNDRLNYTALGDSVNLASRLEALNKTYGTNILIGENTYESVKGQFMCRLVDRVAVRGHTKGVYIYELLPRDAEGLSFTQEELQEYNKEFLSAFKLYEVGDWERARAIFSELLKKHPQDSLSALYVKRCGSMGTKETWDGIWKF